MPPDLATLATAQHAHWNGPATRAWAESPDRIDARFAPITAALLDFAAPATGERALDIGCGSGSTTLLLAERVGSGGSVLGLDIAAASVAVARDRIRAAGLAQASVELADAATHAFGRDGCHLLFSRFGTMFFADPVAAFANLRQALATDGRLAMAAWRTPAENAWASEPVAAVRHLLAPTPMPGPDEPGQFAFADAARVRRILEEAGFRAPLLEPFDTVMRVGADVADAVQWMFDVGPVQRGVAGAPPELRAEVRATLAAWFAQRLGPAGVVLPAAVWLIGARA